MTLSDVIDRLEEMRDEVPDPREYGAVTGAIDELDKARLRIASDTEARSWWRERTRKFSQMPT